MSPQHSFAGIGAIATVIQGVAAGVFLYDRIRAKALDAVMVSKTRALILSLGLVFSTIAAGFVTGWLWRFKPAPTIIEKPVTVEKIIPCPPAKTGPATTRGAQSPANSGSGNTTTYGVAPPPQTQQLPPKQKE